MTRKLSLSRRQFLRYVAPGAATLFVASCAGALPTNQLDEGARSVVSSVGHAIEESQIHQFTDSPPAAPLGAKMSIDDIPLGDIPLDWKIGQMLLVGFRGVVADPSSQILQDIERFHVGGVVLFRYNVADPEQLAGLTSSLQRIATASTGLPLLISMDQEGGRVNRLNWRFDMTNNYSASELGRINDVAVTRSYGAEIARNLRRVGVNLNLAPVVDVNVNMRNPIIGAIGRSFSQDPEVVARHAAAFIEGHHEYGILCSLKHFPGHGSSTRDSHDGFVDVTNTWQERELAPFIELIGQGKADAVMTAHIFNANWDSTLPATLSDAVIDGLLRQRIGYQGLVLTDDLQMEAIRRYYSFEDAIRLAILAGVDVLSLSNNLLFQGNVISRAVEIVRQLVEDGIVSVARIDQSYRRILAAKKRILA